MYVEEEPTDQENVVVVETLDVWSYTDAELYAFLDVNNPTDRELETKIYILLRQYNAQDFPEMHQFLYDILHRFFALEEEEEEEEEQPKVEEEVEVEEFVLDDMGEGEEENFQEGFVASTSNLVPTTNTNTNTNTNTAAAEAPPPPPAQPAVPPNPTTSTSTSTSITKTKPVDYVPGQVNPLLKETVRRIITIDSQFRNKKLYPSSTAFTFNLSEPLNDVVYMCLYSIQLPFTWYTISEAYGSNFFYLKGNAPGIDQGSYDFQVALQPGNYKASDFPGALNQTIQNTLVHQYPDVSFGQTQMTFQPVNAKMTLSWDFQLVYNEMNFDVYFPPVSVPATTTTTTTTTESLFYQELRAQYGNGPNYSTSVANLLGFQDDAVYSPYTIVSNPNTTTSPHTNTIVIDSKNSVCEIVLYQGPSPFDPTHPTQRILTIPLTIPVGTYGTVDDVLLALNREIQVNHPELYSAGTVAGVGVGVGVGVGAGTYNPEQPYTEIAKVSFGQNQNQFQYKFTLQYNRTKVPNAPNLKSMLLFPVDDALSTTPLWQGSKSVFQFPTGIGMEFNTIVSPYPSKPTTYVYDVSSQFLSLVCQSPSYLFLGVSTKFDLWIDVLSGSPTNTFTLETLKQQLTKTKPYGKGTTDVSYSYVLTTDASHSYVPQFRVNVEKQVDTSKVMLDPLNSWWTDFFQFPGETKMRNKQTYYSAFQTNNSFPTAEASYSFVIWYVDGDGDATTAIPLKIPVFPLTKASHSLDLIQALNNAFQTPLPEYALDLTHCRISLLSSAPPSTSNFQDPFPPNSPNTNYVKLELDIRIVLTARNYEMVLDPTQDPRIGELWTRDLYFTSASVVSVLTLTSSTFLVTGSQPVYDNRVLLLPPPPPESSQTQTPNYHLQIRPYYNPQGGVYTPQGTYVLDLNLLSLLPSVSSKPPLYTKEEIVRAIQTYIFDVFLGDPLYPNFNTNIFGGSKISTTTGTTTYTNLEMNINKIFRARDYQVVFYDSESFVKCSLNSPVPKNVTKDTTLGWILGFRAQTQYALDQSPATISSDTPLPNPNVALLTGDTAVNPNLYNYAYLVLNDYAPNHLNDGLIVNTTADLDIPLPSYAELNAMRCHRAVQGQGQMVTIGNPPLGSPLAVGGNGPSAQPLTANQMYAANQILAQKYTNISQTSQQTSLPYVQDIFAFVPLKTQGLQPGQTYVEFGGTLQNQDRSYFGPVDLRRMTVELITDKGTILDLNGADWSFSLMIQQLYNPNR